MALALVLLASCRDSSGDERLAPTITSITGAGAPSTETISPAGDPGVTVGQVIQACREKDADRLRSFVAGAVTQQEVEALFARGTDVQLMSQTVPRAEGGRATVIVRLRVRRDGATETADRAWELEWDADGVWRLTALPDCF